MRLLVTRVKGKTVAMLYRAVVPGTREPVPFSSPWRTITLDRVEDVSADVDLAGGTDGNYELSIPLEKLLWGCSPGRRRDPRRRRAPSGRRVADAAAGLLVQQGDRHHGRRAERGRADSAALGRLAISIRSGNHPRVVLMEYCMTKALILIATLVAGCVAPTPTQTSTPEKKMSLDLETTITQEKGKTAVKATLRNTGTVPVTILDEFMLSKTPSILKDDRGNESTPKTRRRCGERGCSKRGKLKTHRLKPGEGVDVEHFWLDMSINRAAAGDYSWGLEGRPVQDPDARDDVRGHR